MATARLSKTKIVPVKTSLKCSCGRMGRYQGVADDGQALYRCINGHDTSVPASKVKISTYKECPVYRNGSVYFTTNTGGEILLTAKSLKGLRGAIDENDRLLKDSRTKRRL